MLFIGEYCMKTRRLPSSRHRSFSCSSLQPTYITVLPSKALSRPPFDPVYELRRRSFPRDEVVPSPRLALHDQARTRFLDRRGTVRARVHDRSSTRARIIVGLAMEQEQAGLGRDGEAHFIGDDKSAATFEPLFREEDLDEAVQFPPVLFGKPPVEREVALQDFEPRGRERLGH